MSPYSGADFFEALGLLIKNMVLLLLQVVSLDQLWSDDWQALALIGLSISSGVVGSFLVLRRMTMVANALSHTLLLGVIIAFLLPSWLKISTEATGEWLFLGALVSALLTIGSIHLLNRVLKVQEDAAIGLLFTLFFAAGIILTSTFTRNAHIGIESVMGHIDVISARDVQHIGWLAAGNLIIVWLCFQPYRIMTFDATFATGLGVPIGWFHLLLMLQVTFTCLVGFSSLGILMVLAFLVIPPAIAKLLTHSLFRMIGLAVMIAILASIFAVALTRHLLSYYALPISTAGMAVSLLLAALLITLVCKTWLQKSVKTQLLSS